MNLSLPRAPAITQLPRFRLAFSATDLGLVALVLFGITIAFFAGTDPDFFWHVKTGEVIVQNLSPPHSDVFSFTSQGKAWIDHEWLSQTFMYGAFSVFGYGATVAVFGAIGVISVLVGYRLMRLLEIPAIVSIAFSFLSLVLAMSSWSVRPTIISAFLLAITYAFAYAYHRRKLSHLWLVPPLMALWSNLHGGYIMGLVILGVLLVAETMTSGVAGLRSRHVARVFAISFVFTGLNPYTYKLWTYPVTYFIGSNASLALVDEWQSPKFFHEPWTIPLGVTILAIAVLGFSSRKIDPWRTGIGLLFTFLVLQSARHQLIFAIVIPPLLAEATVERWPSLLRQGSRTVSTRLSMLNAATAALCAVFGAALVVGYGLQTGSEPRTDLAGLPYPVEGAKFIAANYPEARIFNEYAWGGYLIYSNWPSQRVFVDGRADVHGDVVRQYAQVYLLADGWKEVLARYDVTAVLVRRSAPMAAVLRELPDWHEAFKGKIESVFVRRPTVPEAQQ